MQLLLHSAILPIKLTNGNLGRGFNWYQKANERNEIEAILRCDGFIRKPFDGCVDVHLTRILGPREQLWDSNSGLRGNAKELFDSLVVLGWFHDDDTNWIHETRFFQDNKQRKNGPATKIDVYKWEG